VLANLTLTPCLTSCSARATAATHARAASCLTRTTSTRTDVKIGLSHRKLVELVGSEAAQGVLACVPQLLGSRTPSPNLLLRRRATLGGQERIAFHHDRHMSVVSVALNQNFSGGRLVYVHRDGRVVCPERRVGDATAHDAAAIHGVSRLGDGIRYVLLAVCYEDPKGWQEEVRAGPVLFPDGNDELSEPGCKERSPAVDTATRGRLCLGSVDEGTGCKLINRHRMPNFGANTSLMHMLQCV
jgi:hypothetical protein